jgi:hypothetical protein
VHHHHLRSYADRVPDAVNDTTEDESETVVLFHNQPFSEKAKWLQQDGADEIKEQVDAPFCAYKFASATPARNTSHTSYVY